MSKSKPFDLVNFIFKPVWESEYRERYRGTSRDLKEAKEFLMMNETIFDEIPEFQERALEYLRSKWDGWVEQRHPCWAFLRNYNSFIPKKAKREIKQQTTVDISCSDCGTNHPANKMCPKCYPEPAAEESLDSPEQIRQSINDMLTKGKQ